MTIIKVLGPGCRNCVQTAELVQKLVDEIGVQAKVEKVTDLATIMGYGVMSTPGVVIDEKLVHAGGIPTVSQVRDWLERLSS
jgi:small redox-active disulfide protein 2